jgi:hypothetical protein
MTPTLAAIAAFCWLVPIAAVYPPGALIVGLQVATIDSPFNVSIFHQKSLLDYPNVAPIATIRCIHGFIIEMFPTPPQFPEAAHNASLLENCTFNARLVDIDTAAHTGSENLLCSTLSSP